MSRKIYVGNLPWSTTSSDLEQLFAAHGAVRSAEVISDRETGRSRGFGFVEMETDEGLQAAIAALGTTLDVTASEDHFTVTVDGKPRGLYLAPVPVAPGVHEVVTESGAIRSMRATGWFFSRRWAPASRMPWRRF